MYKPLTKETKAKIICFRATKRDLEKLNEIQKYLYTDDEGNYNPSSISEMLRAIIDMAYESIPTVQ